MSHRVVVAIDGPAGSGKSSVSKAAARALDFSYYDTGAAYRALAWAAVTNGVDVDSESDVVALLHSSVYVASEDPDNQNFSVDGVDVTDAIRGHEVSTTVSRIAKHPGVRAGLVEHFRNVIAACEKPGIVMEGRDISTVVFPDAEIKLYLEADPRIRAERRYQELLAKGKEVTFEETYQDLLERDTRDRERPVGALQVADDAIVFDTSKLTQSEVIDALEDIVRNFDRIPS